MTGSKQFAAAAVLSAVLSSGSAFAQGPAKTGGYTPPVSNPPPTSQPANQNVDVDNLIKSYNNVAADQRQNFLANLNTDHRNSLVANMSPTQKNELMSSISNDNRDSFLATFNPENRQSLSNIITTGPTTATATTGASTSGVHSHIDASDRSVISTRVNYGDMINVPMMIPQPVDPSDCPVSGWAIAFGGGDPNEGSGSLGFSYRGKKNLAHNGLTGYDLSKMEPAQRHKALEGADEDIYSALICEASILTRARGLAEINMGIAQNNLVLRGEEIDMRRNDYMLRKWFEHAMGIDQLIAGNQIKAVTVQVPGAPAPGNRQGGIPTSRVIVQGYTFDHNKDAPYGISDHAAATYLALQQNPEILEIHAQAFTISQEIAAGTLKCPGNDSGTCLLGHMFARMVLTDATGKKQTREQRTQEIFDGARSEAGLRRQLRTMELEDAIAAREAARAKAAADAAAAAQAPAAPATPAR